MSKQSTSARSRAASQPAQSRRQRHRPRGEVYRQAPRVRARTQSAVQALDAPHSDIQNDPDMALSEEAAPALVAGAAGPDNTEQIMLADTEPLIDTNAPGDSQTSPRLPRRTRTLADVVQPRRDPALSGGSLSVPSLPSIPSLPAFDAAPTIAAIAAPGSLSDPALFATDPTATVPTPTDVDMNPQVPAPSADALAGDELGELSGEAQEDEVWEDEARTAPLAVARALTSERNDTAASGPRPAASIPVPHSARLSVETRPIAAADGAPSESRPGPHAPVGDPWGTSPAALKDDEEVPSRFLRSARQGALALAARVALGHTIAAVVLAVVASALVLLAYPLGLWLLALAAMAAAGGGLAYLLLWWCRSARTGIIVLALAWVCALAWGCAIVGPRAALLVLAAPAVALALRAGGRWPALLAGTGLVAVYAVFQLAPNWGFMPAFALPVPVLTAVDTLAVALGMGLLLVELLVAAHARERDLAAARARLYEVRLLRGQIGALRAEVEANGRALDEALAQAARGRGMEPVVLDGPLSLVAGRVNATAERLRTLQHDREECLRLKGATRTLARALERGWLGLPWIWPETSGTMLDEVIVLLRTPRPADALAERRESQDTGPCVPLVR